MNPTKKQLENIIFCSFENKDRLDIKEKILEIAEESFVHQKLNKTNLMSSLSELGLEEEKINEIKLKLSQYASQEPNEGNFLFQNNDYFIDYPKTSKLISQFQKKNEINESSTTLNTIFNFLLQNNHSSLDILLNQMKVEIAEIDQIKRVFLEENQNKLNSATSRIIDQKLLSSNINDKSSFQKQNDKIDFQQNDQQDNKVQVVSNSLDEIITELQPSNILEPSPENQIKNKLESSSNDIFIEFPSSSYQQTPHFMNLVKQIKDIFQNNEISIVNMNKLLDSIHCEDYKNKMEELYDEWNVQYDQSEDLDACIEIYKSKKKEEDFMKQKLQFYDQVKNQLKIPSSLSELPVDVLDQISQGFEKGNIKQLFSKYKVDRKVGNQLQQQWQQIIEQSKEYSPSCPLINNRQDPQNEKINKSQTQSSIIREFNEKILKEEEEKKQLLKRIQEMELEKKEKDLQEKKQLEIQQIEREKQDEIRKQREEIIRKEIEATKRERERKLEKERELERIELENLEKEKKEQEQLVSELKEKQLSQEFQIIYQQEDICFNSTTLKIVCDKDQVKLTLQNIERKSVKTIGFFGDFQMAVQIIKQMYPSANQIFLPDRVEPKYDRLITFSDGQILFLLLEDAQGSFDGKIYDNDDGLLLIRYLLDTCTIVIACLNSKQINNWTDQCPYEDFSVSLPPKIVRDRSIISCNEIKTKKNVTSLNVLNFQLFPDYSQTILTWIESESSQLDRYSIEEAERRIKINKDYINDYISQIFQKSIDPNLSDLVNYKKQIQFIFQKNTMLFTEVSTLFSKFQQDCFHYFNNFQNEENNQPDPVVNYNYYQVRYEQFNCQKCQFKIDHKTKGTCCSLQGMVESISTHFDNMFQSKRPNGAAKSEDYRFQNYSNRQLYYLSEKLNFNEFIYKEGQFLLFNYAYQQGFKKQWAILKQILLKNIFHQLQQDSKKQLIRLITEDVHFKTFDEIEKNQLNQDKAVNYLKDLSDIFLSKIDMMFEKYKTTKSLNLKIQPLIINYSQSKEENYISPIKQLEFVAVPDAAHSIIDYISFDENVDFILTLNSNDPKTAQRVTFWSIKKKVNIQSKVMFNEVFSAASNDISFYLNKCSKQWVLFDNQNKRCSLGKINQNYKFEEGRLEQNVYQQCVAGKEDGIRRVDRCTLLNEIDSIIFLYEKESNRHFEYSLSGRLSVKEFQFSEQFNNNFVESQMEVISFCNNFENNIYVFETENELIITNPNYIIKQKLKIDRKTFGGYKLVETDVDLLLIISDKQLNITSYVLADGEESQNNTSGSSSVDLPQIDNGNIVLDKLLRSIQNYGSNYTDLGCPNLNYLLVAYEGEAESMKKQINNYIGKGYDVLALTYKLAISESQNYNSIPLIIKHIVKLNKIVETISKETIKMIMLTRIPIQISTIQQSSYIPLKDGIFCQEFLEINAEASQVEKLKNSIKFGWYEDVFQTVNRNLNIISIFGRQSVGKSSQLNRMFGTRFGVSAARCTDGVWLSFTKVGDDYLIVLDCEGLFSIRRTEDEEIKLLQQIILISSVSILFCDLEGVSQPLLELFKKLSMCIGKKRGEGIYFQGTLLLLTKNIQNSGDQEKIKEELESHLSTRQAKNTMSSLFKGGISYGFLKPFLTKDFDTKLKQFRNEGIMRDIICKQKKQFSTNQAVEYLQYSLAQLYLDDDTDVEVICLMDSLRSLTNLFKGYMLDLAQSSFPIEKFDHSFTYQQLPGTQELIFKQNKARFLNSKSISNKAKQSELNKEIGRIPIFKNELREEEKFEDETQNQEEEEDEQDDREEEYEESNREQEYQEDDDHYEEGDDNEEREEDDDFDQEEEEVEAEDEKEEAEAGKEEADVNKEEKDEYEYEIEAETYLQEQKEEDINFELKMNQYHLTLSKHDEINYMIEIPKNRMLFEDQFRVQFSKLKFIEHNNYFLHLQEFLKETISSRIQVVQSYLEPNFPVKIKFGDITNKFKTEFQTFCNEFSEEMIICLKTCKKCDRVCVKKSNHKGNCDCDTTHICLQTCQICEFANNCSLNSGHSGKHTCKNRVHLCGEPCRISRNCKLTCRLEINHDPKIEHTCQEKHLCLHQCRQYDKCGKTCSLLHDHAQEYHICESEICFDKCSLCSNKCQIPLHDHDLLLQEKDANANELKVKVKDKNGKPITIQAHHHLCGQQHPCLSKCQDSGVCKVVYEQEEKLWESQGSLTKFSYIFFKPIESKNECTLLIPEWNTNHEGIHQCSDSKNHRCEAKCQECQSFCSLKFGHSGNHSTSSHRNKEKCLFVHEEQSKRISVKSEMGTVRSYQPGESSNPETCSFSCVRQGRAHYHLKVCQGGDLCAEKLSSFARHSKEKYYPHLELNYDQILCKQYWELQGWDPPVSKEVEATNMLCNWACTHESHSINGQKMNYCKLKAFHSGNHDIDRKACLHISDSDNMDICFTIDTTGSMEWVFEEVRNTIQEIMMRFKGLPQNIKFGLVGYKDHPPQDNDYASKLLSDLVDETKLITLLNGLEANGGGDKPESVMDGLRESCCSISWRNKSTRFLFHIGDAPPHGKEYGCESKDPTWTENGCPCGIKKEDISAILREKKINYYLVSVSSTLNMMGDLFKGSFGENFKQMINIKNKSDIRLQVIEALIQEYKYSQELYHVLLK